MSHEKLLIYKQFSRYSSINVFDIFLSLLQMKQKNRSIFIEKMDCHYQHIYWVSNHIILSTKYNFNKRMDLTLSVAQRSWILRLFYFSAFRGCWSIAVGGYYRSEQQMLAMQRKELSGKDFHMSSWKMCGWEGIERFRWERPRQWNEGHRWEESVMVIFIWSWSKVFFYSFRKQE